MEAETPGGRDYLRADRMPGSGGPVDMTGRRFGKLVALTYIKGEPPKYKSQWLCVCDCGNEKIAKSENLVRGKTKSCGCDRHANRVAQLTKHGHTGGEKGRPSPTYQAWHAMRQRCTNPNTAQWLDYGGRGISVCDRWADFRNFLEDMGERPEGKTLDRWPDKNGNYEPGNCRWATPKEQTENQRTKIKNSDLAPLLFAAKDVVAANDNVQQAIDRLAIAIGDIERRLL